MKKSVLAVIVAMTVTGVAHADTIEGAKTELSAISAGMSQAEKQQKIDRFIERVGDAAAAHQYLVQNGFVAPANTMDTDTKVFLADAHANGAHSADVVREWNALTYNQQQDALAAKPALRAELAASIKSEPVLVSAELGGKHTTNETHNGTKPGETGPHLDGTHWVMTPGITKESNPEGEPVPQGELVTDPAKWTGQPGITKETNPKGNPIEISHDFDSVEPAKQPQAPAVAHEAVEVKPRSVLLSEAAARAAKAGLTDTARTFLTRAKEAQAEERAAAQVESNNASRAAYAAQTGKPVQMISPAPAAPVARTGVTTAAAQTDVGFSAPASYDQTFGNNVVSTLNEHQNDIVGIAGAVKQNQDDIEAVDKTAGEAKVIADNAAEGAHNVGIRLTAVATALQGEVTDNKSSIDTLNQRTSQIGTKAADNADAIAQMKPTVAANTKAITEQKDFININSQDIKALGAVVADNKADQSKVTHALVGQNIAQDKLISANSDAIASTTADVESVAKYAVDTNKTVAKQGEAIVANKTAVTNVAREVGTTQVLVKQQGEQQQMMRVQIEENRATGEYAQSRADAAYANTEANRRALDNTNKRVAQNSADIADHEQRITSLEQSTTSKFGALKNEVEQNRKRASAGIAGVAAMANIPQVTQGANFSVGAGVGNTDGESALAVGASARINDSWVVKGSVSNDTQHNFVVGAGASYQW